MLSVATSFCYDLPITEQLPMIAAAGFDHVSLGGNAEHSGYLTEEGRTLLKTLLQKYNLQIDTIHAPGLDHPDAVARTTAVMEAAVQLGAPCIVAHGGPFQCDNNDMETRLPSLISTCNTLAPIVRDHGLAIALENVCPGPATDLVRRALLELDPSIFGLCYDSSHDQIDGPRPFDLIDAFPDRIFAVHLSDRIADFVDHVIPGEGFIAWPELCQHLRQAHYRQPVMLEVMMKHSRFKEPGKFLREAYEAGITISTKLFQ
jgi:sugar phosphate isomerase/epimerase